MDSNIWLRLVDFHLQQLENVPGCVIFNVYQNFILIKEICLCGIVTYREQAKLQPPI